jgi:hypothetical protein
MSPLGTDITDEASPSLTESEEFFSLHKREEFHSSSFE